jgi:hypothetical protein
MVKLPIIIGTLPTMWMIKILEYWKKSLLKIHQTTQSISFTIESTGHILGILTSLIDGTTNHSYTNGKILVLVKI